MCKGIECLLNRIEYYWKYLRIQVIQYIVDTFVDVVTDPDGTRHTEVDLEVLLQASKIFSDDEEWF